MENIDDIAVNLWVYWIFDATLVRSMGDEYKIGNFRDGVI